MKKLIITFLLFPLLSFSQFNFGVKGGFLNSQIIYEYDDFSSSKNSFYIGVFSEYKKSKFAINTNLDYTNTGANYKYTGGFISPLAAESSLSLNQLNLSITSRYYIIEKLSIGIGGYFGLILNGEYDWSKANKTFNEEIKNPDFEGSKIDYGLTGGLEFEIYKGIFIEGRYMFGLKDLVKGTKDYTIDFGKEPNDFVESKNRSLLFGLGYKF